MSHSELESRTVPRFFDGHTSILSTYLDVECCLKGKKKKTEQSCRFFVLSVKF